MTYKKQNSSKNARSPKKPKIKFGLYCKGLRRKLGITISEAADSIGVSQPYLTQLENGTEPLTSVALFKCLNGYAGYGKISTAEKLSLLYEMLEIVETIEIDLSKVTIIHRENLLRLIAELMLNTQYPQRNLQSTHWNIVSGYVRALQKAPPVLYDCLRIIPKNTVEPVIDAADAAENSDT